MSGWTVGDVVAAVVGGLGLIGGVIGFFSGRAAGKAAARAEAAAAQALTRSATANEESAAALKRANEIAEASLPQPQVRWEIRPISKNRYACVNQSDMSIERARVTGAGDSPGLIRPDETEPRTVEPGDALGFIAMKVMGPSPVVQLEYFHPISKTMQEVKRTLH